MHYYHLWSMVYGRESFHETELSRQDSPVIITPPSPCVPLPLEAVRVGCQILRYTNQPPCNQPGLPRLRGGLLTANMGVHYSADTCESLNLDIPDDHNEWETDPQKISGKRQPWHDEQIYCPNRQIPLGLAGDTLCMTIPGITRCFNPAKTSLLIPSHKSVLQSLFRLTTFP